MVSKATQTSPLIYGGMPDIKQQRSLSPKEVLSVISGVDIYMDSMSCKTAHEIQERITEPSQKITRKLIKHIQPQIYPFVWSIYTAYKQEKNLTSKYNPKEIFLVAFCLFEKKHNDTYFSNKVYANIGGISLKDFNQCEQELLINLKWEVTPSNDSLEFGIRQLSKVGERYL